MAESFRFRNDSAISSMPALCTRQGQGKLRDLADVSIQIEPGAAHLLKARQLMHAALHPLLRRNARHRTVIRNELHRTGRIKRVPEAPRISRRYQRISSSKSSVAGRVLGCQLASRYAASPVANAVKRERISCSGAGAVNVPEAANSPRNLPQQAPYTSPLEQGQRSSWLSSTWFSSVMPPSIKNGHVKKASHQESTAQRNARSAGDTNPPAERAFLFSIVQFERTYTVRISGNAYSAIARAGVSAAEGLPTYAPRYLAAGWLSATLVYLPKMFSRRVLPSYSVR